MKLFLFGALRKILENRGKKGIWMTIHGRPIFIPLEKLSRLKIKRAPEPLEKRINYWAKKLLNTPDNRIKFKSLAPGGGYVTAHPLMLELRKNFSQRTLKEADSIFDSWWNGGPGLANARKKLLGQEKGLSAELYSYLSEVQSLNQALLKKAYPSGKVTLYRGIHLQESYAREFEKAGGDFISFPLSSYTSEKEVAHRFTGSLGFVVETEPVSISTIKYSHLTFGETFEHEMMAQLPKVRGTFHLPKQVAANGYSIDTGGELYSVDYFVKPKNIDDLIKVGRSRNTTSVKSVRDLYSLPPEVSAVSFFRSKPLPAKTEDFFVVDRNDWEAFIREKISPKVILEGKVYKNIPLTMDDINKEFVRGKFDYLYGYTPLRRRRRG